MSAAGQDFHHAMDDVASAIDRLTFRAGVSEGAPREPRRFSRILVGYDASPPSAAALAWAAELAKAHGASVVVAHAMPEPYTRVYDIPYGAVWPLASEYAATQAAARATLERGLSHLRKRGVPCEGEIPVGSAPRELARLADARHADLVVVGSHGRGPVGRAFLGSVSDGVRNRTRASVLVARQAPPPASVLVGVDGSRVSKEAAALALALAERWRAKTTILHAIEPLEPDFLIDAKTLASLGLPSSTGDVAFVRHAGPAGRVLARAADDLGAGLVVVGSRGLGRLGELVMGSTASAVCHLASASVLVLRET